MTLKDGARQVHSHRIQAFPNVRFIQNLLELEKELKIKNKKKET